MSETTTETPIACTLETADLGSQVERWKKLYAEAGTERAETDAGLRVSFRRDPAVERELRELVAVESRCCAWAVWRVEGNAQELALDVSSTGDGIAVIHSWLLEARPSLPTSGSPPAVFKR